MNLGWVGGGGGGGEGLHYLVVCHVVDSYMLETKLHIQSLHSLSQRSLPLDKWKAISQQQTSPFKVIVIVHYTGLYNFLITREITILNYNYYATTASL